MKRSILYSSYIFLTTIFIAPVLFQIFQFTSNRTSGNEDVLAMFYTTLVGMVLCIPSCFFIALICMFSVKNNLSTVKIKFFLSLAGIPGIILPIAILNLNYVLQPNYWQSVLPLLISYYLCLTISIWVYKLPQFDNA